MNDLDRVTFGGKVVDRRTAAMLAEAQRIANEKDPGIGAFDLTQGSWSHASASAGTHDGPGAFDMYTQGYDESQKEIIGLALRTVGFASWRRYRIAGTWEEHWHGIAIGTEGLPALAQSQVQSYRGGRDGLRGNGVDHQARPDQILTWERYQEVHGMGTGHDEAPDPRPDPVPEAAATSYDIDPGTRLIVDKDRDHDGLTDSFEQLAGTDPRAADSDHDDLSDGYEAAVSRTDPRQADTDRDGVDDAAELLHGTDPGRVAGVAGVVGRGVFAERVDPKTPDSDRDGLSDRYEKLAGTAMGAADTDRDGLRDATEAAIGSDPTRPDTDNDGYADGFEVEHTDDPLSPFVDADGHVVHPATWTPERAYALRTGKDPDPTSPDAWAIPAGERLGVSVLPGANTVDLDSDADGLTDAFEKLASTDPTDRDSDDDGTDDGTEALASRADPRADRVVGTGAAAQRARAAHDSDSDGLSDRHEKLLHTKADRADSDGDGLVDSTELALGADPLERDTDGDGLGDGLEVGYETDPLAAGSTLGQGLGGTASGRPDGEGVDLEDHAVGHPGDLDPT